MIQKNCVYKILEELNKDGQKEKVTSIENHITIPNHIKNFHNITNPLGLSAILYENHNILHEKMEKCKSKSKSKSKRKGRIHKIKQSKVQTQDKIAKDIIQLFNSNSSYF